MAIPASVASLGERKCTGWPCQIIWPCEGSQIPEMVLISVDLPGPVVPDQGGDLPGRDIEVDPVERLHRAEVLPDAA